MQLTIIANIIAKKGKTELVRSELEKLISVTLAEDGCLNYTLHQDNENPNHFLFYENWLSRKLWQKHMESEHLKSYIINTDGAIAEFTLNEMSLINSPKS